MTVIDANLLLNAYNADAPSTRTSGALVDGVVRERRNRRPACGDDLGVSSYLYESETLGSSAACSGCVAIVTEWLAQPDVVVLGPGLRHWEILERLVIENNARGSLLTDAVLAALAVENGAVFASTDQDFSRFQELRWTNPLSS